MHSADDRNIPILGATILRMSGRDQLGEKRMTQQIAYITYSTDKLFLSREACMDLGIVPGQFPVVGEANFLLWVRCLLKQITLHHPNANCASSSQDATLLDCNPATEEHESKQYLLDYYSSSTFNTCKHQPLPMIEGPPMRQMIDPKAKPMAHHSAIPIPIHWQDDVKAGLDREIRLGVIESVGKPVT